MKTWYPFKENLVNYQGKWATIEGGIHHDAGDLHQPGQHPGIHEIDEVHAHSLCGRSLYEAHQHIPAL